MYLYQTKRANQVSRECLNKALAHAYILIKREGLKCNVHSLNGIELKRSPDFYEPDSTRINLVVVDTIVKKSWIG